MLLYRFVESFFLQHLRFHIKFHLMNKCSFVFSSCNFFCFRREILNHLLYASRYDARIAPNYEEGTYLKEYYDTIAMYQAFEVNSFRF